MVDAFCAAAPASLAGEADSFDAHALIAGEPEQLGRLSDADFDEALEALADFTDLRCASRTGHSRGVAALAGAAAGRLRLPAGEVMATRRAGLVHDIGLHGVPVTILDKPGPLSATKWESVQISSYYTERVLARPATLARIGAIAAFAHERTDGSGYPPKPQRSGHTGALPLPHPCRGLRVPRHDRAPGTPGRADRQSSRGSNLPQGPP